MGITTACEVLLCGTIAAIEVPAPGFPQAFRVPSSKRRADQGIPLPPTKKTNTSNGLLGRALHRLHSMCVCVLSHR